MENEEFVKAMLNFLVKNAPGFFSMLGFLSAILLVVVLRRPVVRVWRKWTGGGEGEDVGGRRRDDAIISQFLTAYKESVQMGTRIVAEIHDLAAAIREQTLATNNGFRDIHRKLDSALAKGAAHGH